MIGVTCTHGFDPTGARIFLDNLDIEGLLKKIETGQATSDDAYVVQYLFSAASGFCSTALMEQDSWLVWSNAHAAWWLADSAGYTTDLEKAGRYQLEDALQICQDHDLHFGVLPHDMPIHSVIAGLMPVFSPEQVAA